MSKYKYPDADGPVSLRGDNTEACEALLKQLKIQVSQVLIKKRMDMKLSQAEFAKYIGTTQSQISRWESGECNFSLQQIAMIATSLDYDVTLRIR